VSTNWCRRWCGFWGSHLRIRDDLAPPFRFDLAWRSRMIRPPFRDDVAQVGGASAGPNRVRSFRLLHASREDSDAPGARSGSFEDRRGGAQRDHRRQLHWLNQPTSSVGRKRSVRNACR
jgi:hypothetical protein